MNNPLALNISEYATKVNVDTIIPKIDATDYSTIINIDDKSQYLQFGNHTLVLNVEIKAYNAKWVGFYILMDFLERSGVADVFNVGTGYEYVDTGVSYFDLVSRDGIADIFIY